MPNRPKNLQKEVSIGDRVPLASWRVIPREAAEHQQQSHAFGAEQRVRDLGKVHVAD